LQRAADAINQIENRNRQIDEANARLDEARLRAAGNAPADIVEPLVVNTDAPTVAATAVVHPEPREIKVDLNQVNLGQANKQVEW